MFATRVLRQAVAHAERSPLIKFIGKRSVPASVDHSPRPHPASPSHTLPDDFTSGHTSFSSYRDHAQQFGPLRKTIKTDGERGVGGTSGYELGPVQPAKGEVFDRNDLPARFRRAPVSLAEIEAVETGGATLFA
ncbi:hypothetical protein SEPCBS119000_005373 [Sporothrix epigloea]|uniref:Uncharacterized protein n=1 Tax=Sporothrix epigloea TaxID=1892477 RepID=A0ABP0E146_9PEZI